MKVYLIGAGPGDAGLLTLKGRDALACADVVVYDALANDSLLGHARPDAERIYVGKVAGNHALPQHEINALLVRKAKEGKVVARLKGGDPYIFGRGGEEAEELLAAGVPFEEVPGISSTIAAPAYAGIPLTHRNFASSVTIITGHENPDKPGSVHNWKALAASASTLEAAVLAAASAVTALLARRLTRPLAVLTDAGAQIAAGDYARRTDLHTGDEIEELSRSFDKMADAVQEKIADLEADVQRREDFVGAFTHELKTPMTSIIGYADMLHTMQTDPDEQREAAAAIVHEGRRLEALSRKLLALLGLNEEGVELTAVPLPTLWPRLHAACPDVTLRTPAAAPTVRGDADLLLDLLCNLVQNAAKASAPGAPVLVLCAQAGDAVTLTVADRGCGIPPELIPRVTEPFFMVDKSRARRQGGSGLGLALCQRIAAAHGSALRIESEPGRGTRVSVTLPVWKEDAP